MPVGEVDEERRDQLLRDRASGALADVDQLGGRRGQRQHRRVDQRVVDDDVGRREQPSGADRQQVGIAGAGADEVDGAVAGRALALRGHRCNPHSVFSSPCQRPSRPSVASAPAGAVHGQQPIDGKPRSTSGLTGTSWASM